MSWEFLIALITLLGVGLSTERRLRDFESRLRTIERRIHHTTHNKNLSQNRRMIDGGVGFG